jgi:FMN phosphatase YigB (HAD superfamily)
MAIKAVFFDLDGTLLPMDQHRFTKTYFNLLAAKLAPMGIAPEALIAAVWNGTKAMVKNDGSASNEAVFWAHFEAETGLQTTVCKPVCDEFYPNEFHGARTETRENPLAAEAVRLAGQQNRTVVLATNPLFPMVGQAARLSWLGLTPENFRFVTSYENSRFCKPNPRYYQELCASLGLVPEECLMVGNDELEDMHAAAAAGLSGYLVTDCLLPSQEHPWHGPRGTFTELLTFLRNL